MPQKGLVIIRTSIGSLAREPLESVKIELPLETGELLHLGEIPRHDFGSKLSRVVNFERASVRLPRNDMTFPALGGFFEDAMQLDGERFVIEIAKAVAVASLERDIGLGGKVVIVVLNEDALLVAGSLAGALWRATTASVLVGRPRGCILARGSSSSRDGLCRIAQAQCHGGAADTTTGLDIGSIAIRSDGAKTRKLDRRGTAKGLPNVLGRCGDGSVLLTIRSCPVEKGRR
mmetsp:Transcript_21564/g.37039  ORF Transcript_21564/g.37039 Transcript_21564/m.37039 type:complete len:232 (+) Transcript_21564:682-1377(+)